MDKRNRSGLAAGVVIILLGVFFLVLQLVPGLQVWLDISNSWPLIIIGVGVFLLVLGLLVGAPAMAVPACIVGGIGGLLFYQNATNTWESWAYAWALIPGFVGVGILLAGLLGGEFRKSLAAGLWLVFISAILFLFFASFLGGLGFLGAWWPVLVIALGVGLLVRALFRPKA
jgi:hypothetical protein